MLNDTGMLMYDIVAPFPGSFPHMVNSFSQRLSGRLQNALWLSSMGTLVDLLRPRAAVVAP